MTRRVSLLITVCLLGCSKPRSFEEILPRTTGEWARGSIATVPPESVPPLVRELGMKRAAEVTYAGPAPTSIRVNEMNVPASAFELMQKWRQQDGRAIYTGPYFVVANAAA